MNVVFMQFFHFFKEIRHEFSSKDSHIFSALITEKLNPKPGNWDKPK